MTKDYRALVLVLFLLLPLACLGGGPELEFIENRRQWDPWIEFGANVPGGAMFLNSGGFHYYLVDGERLQQLHERSHEGMDEATGRPGLASQIEGQYVSMQWSDARPSRPQPFGKHTAYYNYFIGNDPARYADGARSYQGVLYAGIYEGIDLKVYASGKNLKYDFIVAPG